LVYIKGGLAMLKKKFILVSGRVVQAAACYLV